MDKCKALFCFSSLLTHLFSLSFLYPVRHLPSWLLFFLLLAGHQVTLELAVLLQRKQVINRVAPKYCLSMKRAKTERSDEQTVKSTTALLARHK
ncbi:hypothetical protein EDD21DRAFT_156630 [Dissophora ornata]|nr:hypothetical protein EDD21DRAFT_156630 [Dissophora ornata]